MAWLLFLSCYAFLSYLIFLITKYCSDNSRAWNCHGYHQDTAPFVAAAAAAITGTGSMGLQQSEWMHQDEEERHYERINRNGLQILPLVGRSDGVY
jgi:hypothetical protein